MAGTAQGGPRAALAFLQPWAMGVLLGQGWHVYSEVLMRGSSLGLGLCSAAVVLGLLVGVFLCARAASGQAALGLSLFWMSCTLNGGLSAIAQVRLRVGRFNANDGALVVNSFLSSGLLGTSLPHVAMKVAKRPEAEVVMPCVLAVLLTEVICSNEAMPVLKVGVSTFLCAVGIQGIATDVNLHSGAAVGATGIPGATEVSRRGVAGGDGRHAGTPVHEPFFPATVMESRRYSPHFLLDRRARCLPNGIGVVPLVSLVGRQGGSEPTRSAGGRGKERPSRGQRPRASEEALVTAPAPAPAAAAPAEARPEAALDRGLCAEAVARQRGAVGTADVGTDIRWDVVLEEMRRVDGGKAAKVPELAPAECCESDAPDEVFAELAEGDAELEDGLLGGSEADEDGEGASDVEVVHAPAADDAGTDDAPPSDIDVTHVPLDGDGEEEGADEDVEGEGCGGADADDPEALDGPEAVPPEVPADDAAAEAPAEGAAPGPVLAEAVGGEALARRDVDVSPGPPDPDREAELGAPVAAPGELEKAEEPPAAAATAPAPAPATQALQRLPLGGRDGFSLDAGEDEYDVPWLEAQAPMPMELDSSEGSCPEEAEEVCATQSRRLRRQRGRERGRGRELDLPPPCLTATTPGAGLPLIELPENSGVSPSEQCKELPLDGNMPGHAGRVAFLPMTHMSHSAVASSLLSAAAEEFVPVEAVGGCGGLGEVTMRQSLRADAEAFCPGSGLVSMISSAGTEASQAATGEKLLEAAPALATEASAEAERRPGQGLRLQLFPDDNHNARSPAANHGCASVVGAGEQSEVGYSGRAYNAQAAMAGAEDRWSTPFGSDWGPVGGTAPAHVAREGLPAEKAFDSYGYGTGAWDEYGAYVGTASADDWAAYGTYGGGNGNEYTQTGYEYEDAVGPMGNRAFMSVSAAEFVPSCWGAEGQLPPDGGAEDTAEQEPVASLLDPELPDPGLGRASAVRRAGDAADGTAWGEAGGRFSSSHTRTLWVSDVENWMTEGYISDLFAEMALVTNVKVIRDRSVGFSSGCALVELASHSAAIGVLEALGGEPIVAKDGCRLGVRWSASEAPLAEHEWPAPWDAGRPSRASEGRGGEGRIERRARRDRDRGEGRGLASRGEGGGYAESSGGRRGRKGDGAARDAGPEADGPQRRRGDSRAETHDGRNEAGRGAGWANGTRGEVCWAYVDPNDQLQVGFTSDEMRQWHELGYFDGDLRVALMHCGAAKAKYSAPPPPREFYPLRQWFPDPAKSFTYIPKF